MTTPTWSTACPDWAERIVDGRSLTPPPLYPAEAQAALDVLTALRIVDAAGSPTFGESSRRWFLDFAAAIFGSYDAESGRRLIREALLLIAKKNGKSTDAAAIMITALVRNWRLSAEYYILAPTIEVANNSFFPARDMILADPELSEILDPKEHLRTIFHRTTKAFLKVVAADAETVSGKKAVGILIDELWLFGKRANAANMLAEATGGLVSRPEGFVIYLTTQSDEPPAGVFREKLDYFRKVRDGIVHNPRMLPLLFEFPPPMLEQKAYLDPKLFHVTNPNLGLSVDESWLAEKLAEAQASGDHALNVFVAKHLNVEIGQSLRADRWPGAEFWPASVDPTLTLESLIERSEVITIGIDGGGLDDLLGLAVLGREAETGRWLAWGRAYAHISVLRRRKSIASEIIDFAFDGDVWVYDAGRIEPGDLAARLEAPETPRPTGDVIPADVVALVDVVKLCLDSGKLGLVGMDPAGVGLIKEGLKEIEVSDDERAAVPLQGVPQGWALQGVFKTLERMLADGALHHADQRLMSWCVGNAKTELRGNNALITKAAAGVAKIDPLMALADAAALMGLNPEPAGSVYSGERGLISFG